MSIQKHEVRFATRRTPADARARCTCGWFTFGSLSECQDAAAVHEVEWVEEPWTDPRAPLPVVSA